MKTITFDTDGYCEIDGHIFEDPEEARKYMKYEQLADEGLITRDAGGNITANSNPATAALPSYFRTALGATTVAYDAEYSQENIDHVVCLTPDPVNVGNSGNVFR